MARDTHRAAMIHHQVSVLKERGVDAAELIVEPEPLSAAALFRRGAGPGGAVLPSREMAEKAFQALRDGGFVDASGCRGRPAAHELARRVRPVVPEAVDSPKATRRRFSVDQNVAWARHESHGRAPGGGARRRRSSPRSPSAASRVSLRKCAAGCAAADDCGRSLTRLALFFASAFTCR